ncbi:hypothetical protein OSTOST_17238, partial [Ostertagia ostertagi]
AAHFGCSATDIAHLLASSLSGKDRREHWEELLGEFYGYLMEEVGSKKMPYSLEQLKEAYQRYLPMIAFMMAPMMGPLFDIVYKDVDETTKKKISGIIDRSAHLSNNPRPN